MSLRDQETLETIVRGKLAERIDTLRDSWEASRPVKHFVVDDLLPEDFVREVAAGFPTIERMVKTDSIRERKYSSADMGVWGEATRMTFLALQSKGVLSLMEEITGIRNLEGDTSAYAGGISAMAQGNWLNPHIDNSTHPRMQGYRRLNALFYVAPDWRQEFGGNLELWSPKLEERKEIDSAFNWLVVMNTNRRSLHSVNRVLCAASPRLCVSNYYFSRESPERKDYHHVTSFRGRPDEPWKDLYLRMEGAIASKVQALIGKPLKP